MSTILAFDFGIKHIGVATGNTVSGTATAHKAMTAVNGTPNEEQLLKLFKEWQPKLIVVGLPYNMDGTEQDMTKRARSFGRKIASRFAVEVAFVDERLTSKSAKEEIFMEGGFRALKKDKGRIDSLSARTILEQYFTEHATEKV